MTLKVHVFPRCLLFYFNKCSFACLFVALVHGEGGKLVEQVGNPTECALLGKEFWHTYEPSFIIVSVA